MQGHRLRAVREPLTVGTQPVGQDGEAREPPRGPLRGRDSLQWVPRRKRAGGHEEAVYGPDECLAGLQVLSGVVLVHPHPAHALSLAGGLAVMPRDATGPYVEPLGPFRFGRYPGTKLILPEDPAEAVVANTVSVRRALAS